MTTTVKIDIENGLPWFFRTPISEEYRREFASRPNARVEVMPKSGWQVFMIISENGMNLYSSGYTVDAGIMMVIEDE